MHGLKYPLANYGVLQTVVPSQYREEIHKGHIYQPECGKPLQYRRVTVDGRNQAFFAHARGELRDCPVHSGGTVPRFYSATYLSPEVRRRVEKDEKDEEGISDLDGGHPYIVVAAALATWFMAWMSK